MKRTAHAMGFCTPCGKLLYVSRKVARKIARQHREAHKSVYQCPVNQALFHVGGVPNQVIRGDLTRSEYYNRLDVS